MPSNATGSKELLVQRDKNYASISSEVAVLAGGGWVVTWVGRDDDGWGIFQQAYDLDGLRKGEETRVNTSTVDDQRWQTVTGLADGGWLVTWRSLQNEDTYGINQQRYDADGAPVGGETYVSVHSIGVASRSDVTLLDDGGWLVTWASPDGDGYGIYQRRYDANGEADGDETIVNVATAGQQQDPSITVLKDGGWVVTWVSQDDPGDDDLEYNPDIHQQRYDALGGAIGDEVLVNTTQAGSQSDAKVAALADGGWVVVWQQDDEGNDTDTTVFQQRFDSIGAEVGDEAEVSVGRAGQKFGGVVAGLADGGWVVCWTDEARPGKQVNGVYQQRYDVEGELVGDQTLVNVSMRSFFSRASVTAFEDGSWVVTWQSDMNSSFDNIYQRRFAADINGGKLADHLAGTHWGERMSGLGGEDTLTGGAGQDVLVGGGGSDIFAFATGNAAKPFAKADTIEDFSIKQKDVIDLSAIDADISQAKNNAFDFIADQAFHHKSGELRFKIKDGDTYVVGDTNGDGKADLVIHLDGMMKLGASSFDL